MVWSSTQRVLSSILVGTRRGCLYAASIVLLGAASVPAHGQVVLDLSNDSLTTYLPSNATTVQKLRPQHLNRGVNIDGQMRSGAPLGWACAGNPFGEGWDSNNRLGDIRLDTGSYNPMEIDLALPSIGVRWVVGRTYNGVQYNSSSAYVSDGYQGHNWMQISQPELIREDNSSDHSKDVVNIAYGADRYLEFQRTGTSTNYFKGKNGTAGVIKYTAGVAGVGGGADTPEKYEYYDQNGTISTFFGSQYCGDAAWQLWKVQDAAGNKVYVGDSSSMATAKSSYGNGTSGATGGVLTAYDSADRRYTYTYTTYDSVKRLTRVKAETKSGGTWGSPTGLATVGQVDYTYYQTGDNTFGPNGCLKTAAVTTPMTSGSDLVRTQHYRYYTSSYANSDYSRGHTEYVMMVVNAEGVRKYGANYATDSNSLLLSYSATFIEYENDTTKRRISKAVFNGECGCSGGTNGEYNFTYGTSSYTNNAGYDQKWAYRTVVKQPDIGPSTHNTYMTQYFDEVGQPLTKVMTDDDPANTSPAPGRWVTEVLRDAYGCITETRTPAANTAYTHSSSTGTPSDLCTASSSVGLIYSVTRSTGVNLRGFPLKWLWYAGTSNSGSANYDAKVTYNYQALTATTPNVIHPFIDTRTRYPTVTTTDTGGEMTSYYYLEWQSLTGSDPLFLIPAHIETEPPTVTTGNNGSNTYSLTESFFNADGTPSFTIAPDGIVSYRGYDQSTGLLVKSIQDADAGATSEYTSGYVPADVVNTGSPTPVKTTYTYDAQGRLSTTTLPNGRITLSQYLILTDKRMVALTTPSYVAGSPDKYYGPASYSISNHAAKVEASGSIGFSGGYATAAPTAWVTTSGNDYSCITTGTVLHLSTSLYNSPGNQMTESRLYTNFTGISGLGSSGTNYDATTIVYDPLGRKRRIAGPTGDISRTVFDALGRPIESWVGTDDTGDAGSPMAGSNNMTKVSATVYDSGSTGGNGYVTSRSQYPEGGSNIRTTTIINDDRGRAIVVTNPQLPHSVVAYDNLGRTTAIGGYSTTSGLTSSASPTTTTHRLTYSQTLYDERGQVYQTIRHKIPQSGGSAGTSTDTLATDYWYDIAGRRVKTQGEELTKTMYDRLGRAQRRFVLAKVRSSGGGDETSYDDADDVSDDVVLEESQSVFDNNTGNVLLETVIMRHPTESTTFYGALDGNSAGRTTITAASIHGRIQITAHWYDVLDRLDHSVSYGTNAIVGDGSTSTGTFTLGSATQTRASTRLRTDYTYPDYRQILFDVTGTSNDVYGTYRDVTDSGNTVTRTWFDDAGRKTGTVANYLVSGTNADQNVITRTVYTNGLMTALWADIDRDGTQNSGDQVTKYYYGVTTGGSTKYSLLVSNSLLHAAAYPDTTNAGSTTSYFYSTSDADVVTFAYNALGQQTYQMDQAGNILTQTYDTGARLTKRTVDTVAGGFDSSVRRIELTYVDRGMTDLVTQYDATSSGTELDQLQYSYDEWGNLIELEQDPDSKIGNSGRAAYNVQYSYAKSSPSKGRRTLRRTQETLPGGKAIDFAFGASGDFDDLASRVSLLSISGTNIAGYTYAGASWAPGTELKQANAEWKEYSATLGSYPDLDQFNRIIHSRWTSTTASKDFYSVDVSYDQASNITSTVDNVLMSGTGSTHHFDVLYGLDGVYRLTSADEGALSGGSIGTRRFKETWTLTQTGNFSAYWSDLDASNSINAGDVNDSRTHNDANEIATRRPDGTNTKTVTHDAAGNMTDDGIDYKYVYDPLGRLRQVKDQSNNVVSEYRYNGLGYRIGWHYDSTRSGGGVPDGTVDSNDPWFYFGYDERWRVVGTYRASDSSPKEQYVYHNAGLGGYGGSSYIDSVVLRDRDANTAWISAADGTLEERRYYCQNWRNDVSAVLTDAGHMVEWIKYTSYGLPYGLPAGDTDSDGDYDTTDENYIKSSPGYDVRGDVNLDGVVNNSDAIDAAIPAKGTTLGLGQLSRSDTASRKGYAGYENDGNLGDTSFAKSCTRFWHVRNRVLDSALGRWTKRDPMGYVDGLSLYSYVKLMAIRGTDPSGLWWRCLADIAFIIFDVAQIIASIDACLALPNPACLAAIASGICSLIIDLNNMIAHCFGNIPPPEMQDVLDALQYVCRGLQLLTGDLKNILKRLRNIISSAAVSEVVSGDFGTAGDLFLAPIESRKNWHYRDADGPTYVPGHGIILGAS